MHIAHGIKSENKHECSFNQVLLYKSNWVKWRSWMLKKMEKKTRQQIKIFHTEWKSYLFRKNKNKKRRKKHRNAKPILIVENVFF